VFALSIFCQKKIDADGIGARRSPWRGFRVSCSSLLRLEVDKVENYSLVSEDTITGKE